MARLLCVSLCLFILTCFAHHIKAATNVDLETVGEKDKYFSGRIIETLKPIGFQQCLKVCGRNTNCLSINYNKEHLTCELLTTTASNQTHLQPRTGYVYAAKNQMDVCKELHCNQTSQCHRTKVGTPVCLKSSCPPDCQDIEITKVQANTVQRICPFGDNKPIEVQCETNGGDTWTIIQRRFDGSEDFYRTWEEYKNGFGNAQGEYWIGNDVLHALTTAHNYQLFMEGRTWSNEAIYAQYTEFTVADEESNYTLSIDGYSGNYRYGDGMSFSNRHRFSTKDKPVYNADSKICSELHHSGWWHDTKWYSACTNVNPNGKYPFKHLSYGDKNFFSCSYWYTDALRSVLLKIQHN